MNEKNYLVIDASTEACSVALQYQGNITSLYELCPQSHSLRLLPMIDDLLKAADCTLSKLDGIIFGQGPGSFTGVRIGIGVTQGLAFSASLPVVGVSTLQTMAQQAFIEHGQTRVVSAIDARMSEVYTGYYEADSNKVMQPKTAQRVLAPELVKQHYIDNANLDFTVLPYGVGTGWEAYKNDLDELKANAGEPEILFPHAQAMLFIGQLAFEQNKGVEAEHAQPVYVRDTVSWKKLPGK
ncbi:tRNA (adenosine(37)-N6)-threonylcarbamoyltransferase complex dimerization subunit type 1 TsaB [Pseudocolwellia sp. HL-MZ19]|uniref:tRNA (adenosine(37)-N6)-threonylcarbamoyltransferase complex dimerization subunit type 1 TsaB n=1 Tax=unclassified Pseudocolwellia TaxID=2848178 RepID=UPI003CE8B53B